MITLCIYFKINHQSTINYGWVNNWNGRPKQNERFIELIWICWRNKRLRGKFVIYLASVGLYVTSYLSAFSWEVAHDTLTDVGFKNVTVMFSGTPGPPGIEPATRKNTVRKQKREKKKWCVDTSTTRRSIGYGNDGNGWINLWYLTGTFRIPLVWIAEVKGNGKSRLANVL